MLASRFSRVFRSSFASSNALSLNRLSLPSLSSPINTNTININAFSPIRSFSSSPSSFTSTPATESDSSIDTEGQYGYSSVDNYIQDDKLFPGQHGDPTNRAFAYFMQGTSAFLYASVARVAVIRFVATLSASADVLALSSLEVDLTPIQEGTSVTVKWRGKPVFIRHRTAKEIATAKADDAIAASFRHPEQDAERVKEDKWMIVLGVCTHLGCVPIGNSGDYQGWFCPCHGSHYDTSGRIRKGPAPLNLEVPTYKFTGPTKVLIG